MSEIADKINYFAIRSFRDTADRDYINARMAFRAELLPQFRWSALHALEKYAKCLLILQRVPKSNQGRIQHEVIKSINLLPKKEELKLSREVASFLSDSSKNMVQGIATLRFLGGVKDIKNYFY